jgi:hypothetical protein
MQTYTGEANPHPNHMENRLAYAQRIIALIDEHMPAAKAANLCLLNRPSWDRIATLAGEERKPSEATISVIIAMVRGRELAIEALQASLGDASKRLLTKVTVEPKPEAVREAERV